MLELLADIAAEFHHRNTCGGELILVDEPFHHLGCGVPRTSLSMSSSGTPMIRPTIIIGSRFVIAPIHSMRPACARIAGRGLESPFVEQLDAQAALKQRHIFTLTDDNGCVNLFERS